MKRGVFEIIQSTLYYKSGIYLLIYSFCNSVIVAVQQIFFKVKLEEYGIEKFIHYFIIAIFGLILIIVSGFVRKASSIQKENELTI